MTSAALEHVNITVEDANATAAMLSDLFGWHVRWSGEAKAGGFTIHVGTDDDYLAVYTPATGTEPGPSSYGTRGGMNHVGVTVSDLDGTEARVKALGYTPVNHADYEPGRRFYFHDENGIEFEVVSYD